MDTLATEFSPTRGALNLDEPAGARLVRLDNGSAFGELDAIQAFAPGQPLTLRCGTLILQGKSLGSQRQANGRFRVRLKLVNLTRPQRETLEARCSAAGVHRGKSS